jgi:2-oxo-4-hydroxy-4-carboxy-5-ureidoimidazoline decarboxylase
VTLDELNRLDRAAFVAELGAVFEHSPWVAERAQGRRPFASIDELHRAMLAVVHAASREEQLALVRAHPELAGAEANAGGLTAHSSGEQARLGLTALGREEFERIGELNRRHREKFGFPCIIALKRHSSRASVLDEMQRRLDNSVEQERGRALDEIGHITRARLEKIVEDR